ncbi:hypothetical protein CTZ27_24885 [Streptomyces griseocarneus]|nr:hypothetical protein CTZ27_24885 [Streptomyces griseocarneus]
MAFEVFLDEDGAEYTGRVPDYPEPDAEPLCWKHHSNSCGCQPEEQEQDLGTGEHRFSTEPPFPPGSRSVIDDFLETPAW